MKKKQQQLLTKNTVPNTSIIIEVLQGLSHNLGRKITHHFPHINL